MKRALLAWCLLFCCTLLSGTVQSQNHRWNALQDTVFFHISQEHGLPHQGVTALAQDSAGYIWVGTQNGLGRWDGYRFRQYNFDVNDPHSLPDNYIHVLYLDRRGRMWVATNEGGLARYDAALDRFVRIAVSRKPGQPGLSHPTVISLQEDGDNALWVGTRGGLDHLQVSTGVITHIRHDPKNLHSIPSDHIRAMARDRQGRLWVGTRYGVAYQDGARFVRVSLPLDGGSGATAGSASPGAVVQPGINSMLAGSDGKLWVGTRNHGPYLIDLQTMVATPLKVQGKDLAGFGSHNNFAMAEIAPGQLWMSSFGDGVVLIDMASLQARRIHHEASLPGSLADDSVWAILRDQSGLVWLGGQNGLDRIDPNQHAVSTILAVPGRSNTLSNHDVYAILPIDAQRLWIGLGIGGMNVIDTASGQIGAAIGGQQLLKAAVYSLSTPLNGVVYAATNRGVFKIDVARQQAEPVVFAPLSALAELEAIWRDGNTLWLGGAEGVWTVDLSEAKPQARRLAGLDVMHGQFVSVIRSSGNGWVWIGTRNNGFFRYHQTTRELRHIAADNSNPAGLASGAIGDFWLDSRGWLWVASQGGGVQVLKFPYESGPLRFHSVGKAQGLRNQMANSLQEDGQGRIWVSTDDGLAVIDPHSLSARMLQRADGVVISGYWLHSSARASPDELLFGGVGGLTVVRPALFKDWQFKPPLVITQLMVGGKQQAPAASVVVQPDANSISVEFAALDYASPEKNQYSYWLQGYDRDWVKTESSRRLAAYTNLPPGDYRLHLRGSNRSGVWASPEQILQIKVLPAWYQSWWYYALLAALTLAAILGVVQFRTRYLRLRQQTLERQVLQRTHELNLKQEELLAANNGLQYANAGLAQSVDTLRQLGDIGRDITLNLDANAVFQALYQATLSLLDVPVLTIYRMNPASKALDLVFGRQNGEPIEFDSIPIDKPVSNVARVARERQELLIEFDPHALPPTHRPGTLRTFTVLYSPLLVDERLLGVISIQSDQEHAYGERERMIFRTLCAYGSIALANAEAMSALHQAQGQLVQQEKMASLGGMVAGVAHEINTPLGTTMVAISGVAGIWQRLQQALASGSLSKSMLEQSTLEGTEYSELALRSASRAAELIASFKAIAASSEADHSVDLDLAQYLPEVVALLRVGFEQRGIALQIEVTPGLHLNLVPEALTEALTRVLTNVLDHAFEGTGAGAASGAPQVWVRASSTEAGAVVIEVADNGAGIGPDDLPKVFDPFFSTRSGLGGHIGLGLHVAFNQVVQRLKGQIRMQSKPGEGTCVSILLGSGGQLKAGGAASHG